MCMMAMLSDVKWQLWLFLQTAAIIFHHLFGSAVTICGFVGLILNLSKYINLRCMCSTQLYSCIESQNSVSKLDENAIASSILFEIISKINCFLNSKTKISVLQLKRILWLYSPLRARAYELTANLKSTRQQIDVGCGRFVQNTRCCWLSRSGLTLSTNSA